jgi:ABC-type phosphate transport system substrate-binding protein
VSSNQARRQWLRRAALLVGAALLLPAPLRTQSASSFQIIVHKSNPVTGLTRSDIAKLFLKKTSSWKAGGLVQPVDLRENSEVRRVFSTKVLDKDVAAVKGYWQERIFTGRGVPPIEKSSEAEVVEFVAANEHAIGYVSSSTSLGPNVKVLRLQD